MRVLLLSQGKQVSDQPDYDLAFRMAWSGGKRVEVRNIPYVGYIANHGETAFYQEIVQVNEQFRPDVIFFQFFHGSKTGNPSGVIEKVKGANNHPLIFLSCGDLFDVSPLGRWGRMPESGLVELARHADAFFMTSMGELADYFVRQGVKNIIFLPHAYCPQHFGPIEDVNTGAEERFFVSMVSSVGIMKERLLGTALHAMDRIIDAWRLHSRFEEKFGLWGAGWRGVLGSRGRLPFQEQIRVFRQSRMVVDARSPLKMLYYASDRPFFISGSGASLVMFYMPRMEKIFKPDVHAYYVNTPRQLIAVCEKVLSLPDEVRLQNCRLTKKLMKDRHQVSNRVDTIISTAESLRKCRRGDVTALNALRSIRMWHFLPEVNLDEEYNYCVANWVG